jgi:DNA-binding CsgD family transcriptional regulator
MPRGRPRHADVLTPREWQVLGLLRQGLTNANIAVRLHVSPETVKTHVGQILSKLEVSSRQEAAQWAERHEQAPVGWPGVLTNMFRAKGGPLGAKAIVVVAVGIVAVIATLLILALLPAPTAKESLGKLAYIQDGNLWVKELPDGQPIQMVRLGRMADRGSTILCRGHRSYRAS